MATPPKGRSDKGPAIVSKPYCPAPFSNKKSTFLAQIQYERGNKYHRFMIDIK